MNKLVGEKKRNQINNLLLLPLHHLLLLSGQIWEILGHRREKRTG